MRILADENLYDPLIFQMRENGHEVMSVRESGLSGETDDNIYLLACSEKRIIVTMDKDFSRTFRFPPGKCGGVILVKLYGRTVAETASVFGRLFNSLGEEDVKGNLVIMTFDGIRIRRTSNKP